MARKKTPKIFTLIAFVIIFVLGPTFYFKLIKPKTSEAYWWNETWLYRRAINITNSSGSNLTNFQVSFTLDTASLISAGKMQSDCDDIRITDIGGNLLPHWTEENNPGCNNSATKIWTKIPSLPTSGATIYVYYGNSSASNIESGNDVFEFFDDFESYPEGSNINNQGGWITNSIGGSGWAKIVTYNSRKHLEIYSTSNFTTIHHPVSTSNSGYSIDSYFQAVSALNDYMMGFDDGNVGNNGFDYNGYYFYFGGSNNTVSYLNRTINGSRTALQTISDSLTSGSYYKSSFIWIGYNLKVYRNNVLKLSGTDSYYSNRSYISLHAYTNAKHAVDWIFVRKYASTEPSTSLGSEEQSQGPVAYWKFDEGAGSITYDSSPNKNNGTITGANWQTEDLCTAGKCLKFDGTDDYVGIGSTANDIKTVSFWVKTNTNTTGLIGLNASSYISVSSGTISATGFSSPTIYVNGRQSTTLETNKWQHIVITTNTGITGSAITLGKASSSFLQGFLDEVKIYNYARTPAQIKADYNAGKAKIGSTKGSSVVMSSPDKGINLSEGLVGYWKMNESSGNPVDSSGNNLTLTNNGSTTFVAGKFGNGSEHVPSSSQYFSTNTTISGVKTVSFWVNPDSNTNYYIDLNGSAYIQSSSGTISAPGFTNPKIYVNGQLSTTITADTWSLITLVTDTAIDASSFKIGKIGNNYFDGTLDEVRIYNRALSPAEVRALYEWAPGPVAHFKLDDGSGTSPIDSSGFGKIGSIINGIWSLGKFGKGLKLDGSGDYLEINDF